MRHPSFRANPILGVSCAAIAAVVALVGPARSQDSDTATCEKGEIAAYAIRACTALLALSPDDAKVRGRILTYRGNAWMKEREADAAITDFAQAIKLDPKNAAAIEGRAQAETFEGQHDLATADWGRLIAIHPERHDFYLHRGTSELAGKKPKEALADFSKTIELEPKSVAAFVGRAKAYDQQGNRENALKEFDLALNIDPGYIPAYLAKAEAAERWGDKNLAVESLATALRLNGMNLHVRQELQRLGVYTPSN